MRAHQIAAAAALAFSACVVASPTNAYESDAQSLRVHDMIADPSVPLAWDHRRHPETWAYRHHHQEHRIAVRCGKRAYWDGDECILKRRYR